MANSSDMVLYKTAVSSFWAAHPKHCIRVLMASPSCSSLMALSSGLSRTPACSGPSVSQLSWTSLYALSSKFHLLSCPIRGPPPQVKCSSSLLAKHCSAGGKSSISGCVLPVRSLCSKRGGKQPAAASINGAAANDGELSDDNDGRVGQEADLFLPQDNNVIQVELHKEASESYLAYSLAVIVGRALPDVRDGLKPVHRRILFAMHELGLSSTKPFKKSARVVGEVLGKYHPHGDSAVYDALVRMAQNFSLRSPLLNGHGNFGSIDADPPAAMRYTECRLEAIAESMLLADLEMDTVNFVHNFDESQQEPVVLPARLPNVLLNGASGIAVGMATNIPPHNLGEVADAVCALIRNPNATVEELMEYVPGPDFPTGGQILGTLGIVEAYRTGRGKVTLRGLAQIEQVDKKGTRFAVVITELPYQTNKAALVEQIADMVSSKTLEGVSDIRDESDRSGMQIVVEVKRGVLPQVVLNNLYKYTGLQTQFSCNMVAISGGEPQTLGLKEFLKAFLDFRCTVVERRSAFQLKRAVDRDHLVEGFIVGLQRMDQVVSMIRAAKDASSASRALQEELGLSSVQAEGLLAMPLRRLTTMEKSKLEEEHEALTSEISGLKQLLASRQRVLQVIEKEVMQLKHDFGTPRRTRVEQGSDGQIGDIDVIANNETLVTLSARGYIKRMPSDTFTAQNRGTQGKSGQKMKTDDSLSKFFVCRAHDYVLFFSERGVVYSIRAYQIPECSRTAIGSPLVQILAVPAGERITSVLSVSEFSEDQYLVMLTSGGFIKRTSLSSFATIRPSGIVAMQLEPGDELRWVRQAAVDDVIVMGSQRGQVLEWICSKLRPLKRPTKGLRAMKLKEGDRMAALDIVPASYISTERKEKTDPPWMLFITANGFGKRVPVGSFREGGKVGTIGMKFQEGDSLVGLFVVGEKMSDDGESDEQVVIGSQSGIINRLRVRDVSIQSRKGRGVKLMRLEPGDLVKSLSLAENNLDETEGVVDSPVNAAV